MSMKEMKYFEKSHSITLKGQNIEYRSICEDFPVCVDGETPIGTMFTYSYLRTDVENDADRPVIFAFNGGPGSSSLWLHTGLLSPKKVQLDEPLHSQTVPPFALETNESCLLDLCDVVVIDPMGTGYGAVFDEARQQEAYTCEKDAVIFAEFIQWWLNRYDRWQSPKYLMGESYGTMRACILSNTLMGGPVSGSGKLYGISLDGIIMEGTCLFVDPRPNVWNEYGVPQMLQDMQAMAAVNWYYHQEGKPPLSDWLKEVRDFIDTEGLRYFYMGNRLGQQEQQAFIQKLAGYTGLPELFLKRKNCSVTLDEFSRELLAEEGLTVGMYDARFTLPQAETIEMQDPVGDESAMGSYSAAYRGAFAKLCREELGIDLDREYSIINFNVNGGWKYDNVKSAFAYLQLAVRRNPAMKVLIGNGCYDLVTTIGQARYAADHLNAAPGQVVVKEYPSGHMGYVDNQNCEELCRDIRELIGISKK